MKHYAGRPSSRWRDRLPGGVSIEDRAATLLREALAPVEPDGASLARIESRLFSPPPRRWHSLGVFRLALVGLFLLAGLASVKAYEAARRAGWFGPAPLPTNSPRQAKPRRPSTRATPATPASADGVPPSGVSQGSDEKTPEPAQAPPAPAPQPEVSLPVTASERPQRRAQLPRRLVFVEGPPGVQAPARQVARLSEPSVASLPTVVPPAPAPAVAPPAPAPIVVSPAPVPAVRTTAAPASEEIYALDRALGLLRRDGNASAALAALDGYFRRFPHGLLNREAQLARVDALLLLGRSQDVLAALEVLPFDNGRRSTELQIIRGELRARTDCARAEADFSAALAHSPDARLLERILYGRGDCRIKLGNREGAASDLQRYLERFSSGPHAAWARAWLATWVKKDRTGG